MRTAIRTPYYYWSGALSDDVCDLIIKEGTKLIAKPASINSDNTLDKDMRVGLISWFDENCWIEKLVVDYVGAANIEAEWKFNITGKERLQFANYYEGAFYDWHRDCNTDSELYRKLSVTVQLSDPKDYEGGELQILKPPTGLTKIPKKAGTLAIFDSTCYHRVTKVREGRRDALVGWVIGPRWK